MNRFKQGGLWLLEDEGSKQEKYLTFNPSRPDEVKHCAGKATAIMVFRNVGRSVTSSEELPSIVSWMKLCMSRYHFLSGA